MRSIVTPLVVAAFGLSAAACSYLQFRDAGSQCSSSQSNMEARDIPTPYSTTTPLYAANAVKLSKRLTATAWSSGDRQAVNGVHPKMQTIKLTSVRTFLWTGDVWIGQPEQGPFRLRFNTGDEHLWVTSSDYKAGGGYKTYDHTKSSGTKEKENVRSSLTGTSGIAGPMYKDKVRIGNLELDVPFISATTRPPWEVDGDFGLGLNKFIKDPPNAVFQQHFVSLVKDHNCVGFSFYLSRVDPKFLLCDFDPKLAPGGVEYHFMVSDFDGWAVGGAKVFVDGKDRIKGKYLGDPEGLQTVFHSGVPYVAGPRDVVATIYESIDGQPKDDNFYYFPCEKAIKLSFSWENLKQWDISREDFILLKSSDGKRCVGSLVARPKSGKYSSNQRLWILGGSFMKDKLTVFDLRRRAIGFHEAKEAVPEVEGPKGTKRKHQP